MDNDRWIQNWLCDMDGVLINDDAMIVGAAHFLIRLRETGRSFMILTNNSLFTPGQIRTRLLSMGIDVEESQIWTSASATAQFVQSQRPFGTAFVIGEESIHQALSHVGYLEDSRRPDYVVLGETWDYSFDDFTTAIRLIDAGSFFVATNPESTGPTPDGALPGCGAMAALVQRATGVSPYVVGKPNSRMLREAMVNMGAASHSTIMIGDRMETDVLAGVDAGLETILVLSGANEARDATRYPYRPTRVLNSIADLIPEI